MKLLLIGCLLIAILLLTTIAIFVHDRIGQLRVKRRNQTTAGQVDIWKERRRLLEDWATDESAIPLPEHVENLRQAIRAILERVHPWPSSSEKIAS